MYYYGKLAEFPFKSNLLIVWITSAIMSIGGGYLLWHLFLRQHALGQSDPFSNQAILNAFGVTFFYFVFMLGTLLFSLVALARTIYRIGRILYRLVTSQWKQ